MGERYAALQAVIADTFPDIHWRIASRESAPIFYGYIDGYKYKLPELVTPEGTEAEIETSLISTLKDWWARRPVPSPSGDANE